MRDFVKEPPSHATISAHIVEAIAPMLKEVDELIWSDEMFLNQVNVDHCGLYVYPIVPGPPEESKGINIMIIDPYRLMVVTDPAGYATEPLKLYLPKGLLKAAKTKYAKLIDENGQRFKVRMEPWPLWIHCFERMAIVSADHRESWQVERFPGTFGSWENKDHDNVRDMSSYRMAKGNISHFLPLIEAIRQATPAGIPPKFDIRLLEPICFAAKHISGDREFELGFSGTDQPLHLRTADGMVMASIASLAPNPQTNTANKDEQ